MLLGVDVGGTFTDAVIFDGHSLHTAKAPTTAGDQSGGVLTAVEAALRQAGAGAGDVESLAHGMTVGTNALLTGGGADTALIATAGFTDLLAIGRQNRPQLYHPCTPRPVPLARVSLGASERVGPAGVVEPLAVGEAERLADAVRESGVESVAVCLLFSYVHTAHEHRSQSACAPPFPTCTSRPRTKCCRNFVSTSAAPPRSWTPTWRRCWPRIWTGSAPGPPSWACPSRS